MVGPSYPPGGRDQTCSSQILVRPLMRLRRGKGFSNYDADGELLTDDQSVQRIKDLAIPAAWRKVWISPHPNGHIQAIGTDAAGHRQYRYHQKRQEERAEEKFDRVLQMSSGLPGDARWNTVSNHRRYPPHRHRSKSVGASRIALTAGE